jgi:hypothetical protein
VKEDQTMSEQWGTLSTKNIPFDALCRSILSIPAARACTTQEELADLLSSLYLHQNERDPGRVDGEFHGWAYDAPDNIPATFRRLVNDHPHAHVRAYYTDTRGYAPEQTWVHTPTRPRSDDLFGELRGVLGHGASRETFAAMAEVLGDLEPDPRVLEYARAHVASWPPEVARPAPLEWLWNLHQWGEASLLSLCNRVEVPHDPDASRDEGDPLHVSFRVLGADLHATCAALFGERAWLSPSREDFLHPYRGLDLYEVAPDVTELTLHTRRQYACSHLLNRLQAHFPSSLVHVHACNAYGDYAYTQVHKNLTVLYHEDLEAPLAPEARIVDPRGAELSFDPSSPLRPEVSRAVIRLLDEMGAHAGLLQLSRLSDTFANAIPGPDADPVTPAAQDMRRCVRTMRPPRYEPTSRDDYIDPIGSDEIPF